MDVNPDVLIQELFHSIPSFILNRETEGKILREFDQLGMDFSPYQRRNEFKVLDMSIGEEMEMEDAASEIMDAARTVGADRLVIDSLSSMVSGLESDQKRRRYVRVIYRVLERLGCTSIAISEIPTLGKGTNYGFEEFLADGVIVLRSEYEENELKRRMEILKMRGSNHSREVQRYYLTDNGLELAKYRV
ncbi:hypothetical protein AKJ41_02765 [candidate division MSBL1 archaeon SCGC-AAA259O05]|uniref:KaiC domain-containing protein n=1 Tax=candidate division MSBL1 archaeon SCGC-AAA259O05 TaxID=1698271 RepID=A0A133V3R3_9EURY|nr:hypothetical protein AKJ41_02765 [candidate division MSBL1 archaeon SCGC-AAA259O05]